MALSLPPDDSPADKVLELSSGFAPLEDHTHLAPSAIRPRMALWLLVGVILMGCAAFAPKPLDEEDLRRRSVTQRENDVRVSATVLDAEESETVFDLPLYEKGIQPVWLEIENNSADRVRFAPFSVDPDYFSPLEVAYMNHSGHTSATRQAIDAYFHKQAIFGSIEPGAVESGFVYTNLEPGTKAFNVDVIGEDQHIRTFTFLIPVAGLVADHRELKWGKLYASHEKISVNDIESFRKALEDLPCCTTTAGGVDPVGAINAVIVGDAPTVMHALIRSGWDETAAAAPRDPLARTPSDPGGQPLATDFLFQRPQDAVFRKIRTTTLGERNQLRLWLSPLFYKGRNVWVGQISRFIRRPVLGDFIASPDVDGTRSYLLQDLWYAESLSQFAYFRKAAAEAVSRSGNQLQHDAYFTDGLCLVAWVSREPVSFSSVRFLNWEVPDAEKRRRLAGP